MALALFVAAGVGITVAIQQGEKRQAFRVLDESRPLLDAVRQMDEDLVAMVAATRGFVLTNETQFTESYGQAVRGFEKSNALARELAADPRDMQIVAALGAHFREEKRLAELQMMRAREGSLQSAKEFMLEAARVQRGAPDHAGMIINRHRSDANRYRQRMDNVRQWVMIGTILVAIAIIAVAALTVWRIEQTLLGSNARQIRRSKAMIAGMADGVMLFDRAGCTEFVNTAGRQLLGRGDLGVAIGKHAEVYGLRDEHGRQLGENALPVAQALATGRAVKDRTLTISRGGHQVAISMTATPLHEDGKISGVVVTFHDITEQRHLEEKTQLQAERAQILADAGAFFASNIDPVWVNQAIAERTAEVLGDWAAVILKTDSKDLRVASIYHRDMASLGLAWSFIYRQPLTVGEGIIGQVIATGYPSLTTNVGEISSSQQDTTSYHAPSMRLASLLILPLRTRRETLGALVIAANDPDRAMTDDKLPLAEVLTERAALAVENAKLYTEQVEARRKVEDLSRLKDEFLSIASHELRTPVTSIKGYTQLAKTLIRENDLATSEEYLDIALDQINRMSRLILELLDVSRIETGRLEIRREPIKWSGFVREVVHRHHTAVSDRRFHLKTPDDGRVIDGDRDRLEQVLGNLLENAVKYSPEGSEIFVTVEDRVETVVTSVCDRGIGIPSDELAQVFERFHRGRQVSSTNYGGMGLGLYITRQIVERHGGSIWVESAEGRGTTFHFSLPVADIEVPAETGAVATA